MLEAGCRQILAIEIPQLTMSGRTAWDMSYPIRELAIAIAEVAQQDHCVSLHLDRTDVWSCSCGENGAGDRSLLVDFLNSFTELSAPLIVTNGGRRALYLIRNRALTHLLACPGLFEPVGRAEGYYEPRHSGWHLDIADFVGAKRSGLAVPPATLVETFDLSAFENTETPIAPCLIYVAVVGRLATICGQQSPTTGARFEDELAVELQRISGSRSHLP